MAGKYFPLVSVLSSLLVTPVWSGTTFFMATEVNGFPYTGLRYTPTPTPTHTHTHTHKKRN